MRFQTVVRDCLYLNWALPREALRDPPGPLRHECHRYAGGSWVFASALLFHQTGVRIGPLSLPGLSYPQMNVRSDVSDAGSSAVLFHRMMVPRWISPGVRLLARIPCDGARLRLPRPSREVGEGWVFRVEAGDERLEVEVRIGAPGPVQGPDLGPWTATTEYFRLRDRGYARTNGVLRRIDTAQESVPLWPVSAEVGEVGLVARSLGCSGAFPGVLHSAWLCPEIPLRFVLTRAAEPVLSARLPAPG
ncbi:MAG: DUF2071 domain-containing protein [Thermoanaerobaculia bacterium]